MPHIVCFIQDHITKERLEYLAMTLLNSAVLFFFSSSLCSSTERQSVLFTAVRNHLRMRCGHCILWDNQRATCENSSKFYISKCSPAFPMTACYIFALFVLVNVICFKTCWKVPILLWKSSVKTLAPLFRKNQLKKGNINNYTSSTSLTMCRGSSCGMLVCTWSLFLPQFHCSCKMQQIKNHYEHICQTKFVICPPVHQSPK